MNHNHETTLHVTRDLAVSRNAMVAAKHPAAVEAALDILDAGGNAVDAAATAAFAIGVVEPWMSGIGGVGFMTIQMAGQEPVVIDYFGRAPQAARPDMFELTGEERSVVGFGGVKDQANAYGPRSCLVPGMVAGAALAVERYGTRDIAEVVAPAIALAEEGFAVNWYNGMLLSSQQQTIRRDPETTRIFLANGTPPAPLFGQPAPRIRQPELAGTLRTIAQHGRDGFYTGEVAESIASHLAHRGGIMTVDDLARYEPVVVAPIVIDYQGYQLVLLPFQGGGITLAETFNILDGFTIRATGHNTAQTLHAINEASKRSFADRFAYVGDPDFVDIDWEMLASTEYAATRRAGIDPSHATESRPGDGIRRGTGIRQEMAVHGRRLHDAPVGRRQGRQYGLGHPDADAHLRLGGDHPRRRRADERQHEPVRADPRPGQFDRAVEAAGVEHGARDRGQGRHAGAGRRRAGRAAHHRHLPPDDARHHRLRPGHPIGLCRAADRLLRPRAAGRHAHSRRDARAAARDGPRRRRCRGDLRAARLRQPDRRDGRSGDQSALRRRGPLWPRHRRRTVNAAQR